MHPVFSRYFAEPDGNATITLYIRAANDDQFDRE
jgi:hypothetical protein